MQLVPDSRETIQGVSQALRSGQTTCVQVVDNCLRQIERWEAKVHAWVSIDSSGALDRARELDAQFESSRPSGPLHGIPIGIKDLIDVAGWPTGAGSKRQAQQTVHADAALVTRLRDAGAIILGKTVTTQFACFDPSITRNPWNLERTPGGSSSGSAAAVATGMCLAAIGSQTGGSITRPASFCGVAGCKPTFGKIPIAGVFPVAKSLDHPGPLARCVADLALLYSVLASIPPLPVSPSANAPRLSRLGDLFDTQAQPAMRDAFEASLATLTSAGASIAEAGLPATFGDVLRFHRQIMLFELGEVHRDRFAADPDDYLPGMRGLIIESRQVSQPMYDEARRHQEQLRREIGQAFDDADVLVCPAALGSAPDLSTTGNPSFNSPWSYTGLPTVSFPIGLSPDGLPLAIQLVGRHDDEATLFAAALWCERAHAK
ncbi:MAG: amidase [Planctomycetaceae bacterium]|nr:amidase [Planctomycetaceae bacterium]